MSKTQAKQMITMRVPDPQNEDYYQPETAINVWFRTINNMSRALNELPNDNLTCMMIQLQQLHFCLYRKDFKINRPQDCQFFTRLVYGTAKFAISAAACKGIVKDNMKIFDRLIKLLEEYATSGPHEAAEWLELAKLRLKPEVGTDLDQQCEEAFMSLAVEMLVPDED